MSSLGKWILDCKGREDTQDKSFKQNKYYGIVAG
jgi:hypothetical protein